MYNENEDWKPRYNNSDNGEDAEGQRPRRSYQPYNSRSEQYGQNNSGYSRPQDGYSRRPSFNKPSGGYQGTGGSYRQNSYERPEGGYQPRPQRPSYDGGGYQRRPSYNNPYPSENHPYEGQNLEGGMKKRRPRVGEMPIRQNRPQSGDYNNRYQQGGGYQQRPGGQGGRPNGKFGKPQQNNTGNAAPKINKYREESYDPNEELRLNKFLANAGVCSRREADAYIKAGVVKVNGETVCELGVKVKRADEVTFHNDPVRLEHKVYVLLNKPRNCVTTADDPQERLTVMDMVKTACTERIFPVGRLDRNTTGVLLLTNDGDLSSKLTHPRYLKKKIYHVWLDKPVSVEDMQKMADGVELEDGEIHADAISYVTDEDKDQVGVEIHSGRNRVVRRMFESLGYHVVKLDRVYFAGLTKKNLKRGQWRYLTDKEVSLLRMGAFD